MYYKTSRVLFVTNNIKDLPFEQLSLTFDSIYSKNIAKGNAKVEAAAAASEAITDFASKFKLSTSTWFWPQVLAHIATWKLTKNEDGKYDPKSLLVDNCKNNHFNKGIYRVCTHQKRGDFLKAQTSGDAPYYCALVPIILAAFKKAKNIKYSEWDDEHLSLVVEPNLMQAMRDVLPESVSSQDILQARNKGLTVQSGPQRGTLRSAKTTYMLYGIGNTCLGNLNRLGCIMATQIWCAHPLNRNEYMVLDPKNWDEMPPALVDVEILSASTAEDTPDYPIVSDIDW